MESAEKASLLKYFVYILQSRHASQINEDVHTLTKKLLNCPTVVLILAESQFKTVLTIVLYYFRLYWGENISAPPPPPSSYSAQSKQLNDFHHERLWEEPPSCLMESN